MRCPCACTEDMTRAAVHPEIISRIRREDSTPTIVVFWRRWFNVFFLDVRYLIFQSVVVNLVRALMPQRPEALTSFFGRNHSHHASVSTFHVFIWVIRDLLVWVQMAVVLLSIAVRFLASRTRMVFNRTKIIASGGQDTLASFLFSMACSSLFFGGTAIAGLAVFEPIILFVDYEHHVSLFLSFQPTKAQRVDVFIFSIFFFLALGTAAEHLSRREIIVEGILYRTEIGKLIVLMFRLKRQLSVVATLVWASLFFCRKDTDEMRFALRVVASLLTAALLFLHAVASYYALAHLVRTINDLDSDLSLTFKHRGFLLKWHPCTNKTRSWVHDMLRVAKNFFPILLWHVSGRTIAAQIAMFISLCNWLPLLPALQIELYCCVATFTAASILLFYLCLHMNPRCINTSGNEIPTLHVGFGMLVLKMHLLGSDADTPDASLKMVPGSIERLFEAVTISYRWDSAINFNVRVWHREEPTIVQFRVELLRKAFTLLEEQGCRFNNHTLIWFDQASIDQSSEHFKALLVPRMTACYSLSLLTLVLDNSDVHEHGAPDNYFSRIWTFQEFCIPPCIVVLTAAVLKTPDIVEANRRNIQGQYWESHNRLTSITAAILGKCVKQKQRQKGQKQQLFLVVGLDSPNSIQKWLQDHPELITEYLVTIESRVGYKSSDRFAAIMQVIAGVICFTPKAVLELKHAVLSAMAHQQELLRGCPLIDNMTAATVAAGSTEALPLMQFHGSADVERLLAGKPCPGDQGQRTSLLLQDIEIPKVEAMGIAAAGSSVGVANEGGGPSDVFQLSCVEIVGSYVAFNDPSLPSIEVKAVVDWNTQLLRQLVIWPHQSNPVQGGTTPACCSQRSSWLSPPPQLLEGEMKDQERVEKQRSEGQVQAQTQQNSVTAVTRLRILTSLQLVPCGDQENAWAIVLE